jgi:hypothetical protein
MVEHLRGIDTINNLAWGNVSIEYFNYLLMEFSVPACAFSFFWRKIRTHDVHAANFQKLTLESHNKDQIIVRSMIDLAHSLGLAVVAEGVETAESFNLLKQWGTDQIQGDFIARPMDADRLLAWLEYNAQLSRGLGQC